MEDSSKGKRVLFIVPQPFLLYRGSPFRVRATVIALSELGYEIDLLCFPFGHHLQINNVNIIRSFGCPGIKSVPIGLSFQKIILDMLLAIKATKLVLSKDYSLIHGVEETGIIARTLGCLRRIPYIYDMHSRIPEQMKSYAPAIKKLAEWFENVCVSKAGAVITVGDEITSFVRQQCPGKSVFSLEDLPLSFASDTSSEAVSKLRSEFQLQNTDRVILYTGNFEGYQGVDLLIRSFAIVRRSPLGHAFKLVLVGGTAGDGNFKRLQLLVNELGLEKDVLFTGTRPPTEMGGLMAMAEILTSPRIEGTNTPLKIYGYMLARKPQVATDMLSHTQVLNEDNSFLGKPNEQEFASAFLNCIDLINSNPEEVSRRVDKAEKLVKERFHPKKFKQILRDAYQVALTKTPLPSILGILQDINFSEYALC